MSNQDKKIVVVARPGYQVLLNIGNDCLTIDAFTPIDLSNMYDEATLSNCGSLSAHLRDGNLVYFEGQQLPKDPNLQKVAALRQSTAQHIQAQYKQSAVNKQYPNMQLTTETEDVNEGQEKTLQDRVAESRTKMQQFEQKMADQVRANLSTASDHSPAVDAGNPPADFDPTAVGAGLNKAALNMKVAMDVDSQTFIAKQAAARKKLDDNEQAAENDACKEIERLKFQDDDLTNGGQ